MGNRRVKPHYVRRNETVRLPRRMLFFDCETRAVASASDQQQHKAFLIVARYVTRKRDGGYALRERVVFSKPTLFCRYLVSLLHKRECLYVFAHNAEFDVLASGLLEYLISHYSIDRMPVASTNRFFWKAKVGESSLSIIDTMNYWPVKLTDLGDSVGLPKLEMPNADADRDAWIDYCDRDVEVIQRAVTRLCDTLRDDDLGSFAITTSGLAWNVFRHRYMPERSMLAHNRRFITRLERDSFYGGRAEAWRIGHADETLHYLDVNSMYASVMHSLNAPVKYRRMVMTPCLDDLRGMMAENFVIAQVLADTKREVAPTRHEHNTLWPVGHFWSTLASPELGLLLEHGRIKSVGAVALYRRAEIFADFIDYVWTQRFAAQSIGDGAMSLFWKLAANALFGKLAQYRYSQSSKESNAEFERLGSEVVYWPEQRRRYEVFYLGKLIVWNERDEVHPDGVVAISSAIASQARVRLWSLMEGAGFENVYYCDTDAVVVNDAGLGRLSSEVGEGLGQLKLKWSSDEVEILGAKEYIVGGVHVFRGFNRTATWEDRNRAVSWNMQHTRQALRAGQLSSANFHAIEKSKRGQYRLRQVVASGLTVPIAIESASAAPALALYSRRGLPR